MSIMCIVCQFFDSGNSVCSKGYAHFTRTSKQCLDDHCFVKKSNEDIAKGTMKTKEHKEEK